MKLPLVAFACLTLAGCAGMDATECRSSNWYDVGYRDGLFGLQPQDQLYSAQCTRHGAAFDAAKYADGWWQGDYTLQGRRSHSGAD